MSFYHSEAKYADVARPHTYYMTHIYINAHAIAFFVRSIQIYDHISISTYV